VDVVAFLPRSLLAHLRLVLGANHSLTPVFSWGELHATVKHLVTDVVVADPGASGILEVEPLEEIHRQFPTLPVILYTTLAPAGIKAIIRLAKSGVDQVVLSRFDDEPRRFLMLIESIPGIALGDRFLTELKEPLAALPVPVARAIQQLVRSPSRFKNAQDLANEAGVNLRTLYRNLETAGILSPRSLVVSARLLRAYAYLCDPGRSMKDVAAKAGYSSPWQLTQQLREMVGLNAEQARNGGRGDVIVAQLAQHVRRRRRE
jgi:AraC-like DNA-binding protein